MHTMQKCTQVTCTYLRKSFRICENHLRVLGNQILVKLRIKVRLYELSETYTMDKNENCDNYRCCHGIKHIEINGKGSMLETYTVGTLEHEYNSAQSRRKNVFEN